MSTNRVEGSLAAALTAEHRRLDQLWTETRASLAAGSRNQAAARLAEFAAELRRHIADEEEILFPSFEQRTGMTGGGPTSVMRSEHRRLEALLDTIVRAQDASREFIAEDETAKEFSVLMDSHDKKEEGVLYPMMDRAFGKDEGAKLLNRTSLVRRKA